MSTRFETYELAAGTFGYRVYLDDALCIDQATTPGAPGFATMTQTEAAGFAAVDASALETAP